MKSIKVSGALFLAILLSLALAPCRQSKTVFAGSDYISTDTREGRLAVFDDVWKTIDERYYDPSFGGIDWDSPRASFRRAAAEANGSQELYQVLRQMIGTLNDPHTRVFSPQEKFDWWKPRFVGIGITVREVEDLATVVHVDPGSEPARAGMRPGDLIETVDGVPVTILVAKKLVSLSATIGSRSSRYRAVATLLDGEAGSTVKLGWKGKDGRLSSGRFTRYWNQRELTFHISRHGGKYLNIQLEAFTQALAAQVTRALTEKLGGAKGIVLDLRGNGGGDADAMAEIAAVFIGEGASLGRFTDRAGATLQLASHFRSAYSVPATPSSTIPLVVLISERTSSAAEILAAALQKQRHAHLLGTTTCGCVLAIRSRHTLPDLGVLDVSEFDYRTSAGVRLEGRGVHPEYSIPPTRQDLYSKRDRTQQTAWDLLTTDTSSDISSR